MKTTIELEDSEALLRTVGYVNRRGGQRISRLAQALANLGVRRLQVDLSGSSLACAAAIEELVESKNRLALAGTRLELTGLSPTLRKVLRIMGLDARGEIAAERAAQFNCETP